LLKDTDVIVNFKLGADCNAISQLLFDQLPEGHQQASQCKAKLKVYDRCRITLRGRVSLVCKYKGKLTVIDFLLVGKDILSILGWKSCLELGLRKRIYSLEEEHQDK